MPAVTYELFYTDFADFADSADFHWWRRTGRIFRFSFGLREFIVRVVSGGVSTRILDSRSLFQGVRVWLRS
jgi:hypothetical protein